MKQTLNRKALRVWRQKYPGLLWPEGAIKQLRKVGSRSWASIQWNRMLGESRARPGWPWEAEWFLSSPLLSVSVSLLLLLLLSPSTQSGPLTPLPGRDLSLGSNIFTGDFVIFPAGRRFTTPATLNIRSIYQSFYLIISCVENIIFNILHSW